MKLSLYLFLIAFAVIGGLPITDANDQPESNLRRSPPDKYTAALHKALLFFNAQKSGRLPKNNGIPWRGDSGLQDGSTLWDVKGGLVGGYYDAGNNIKYHFPMSFAMTMLSWSLIEYEHKYRAIGEYDHIRDLIKWGTDYLLLTFNSSATKINHIYSQVGGSSKESRNMDDSFCWERPEDMDYTRAVQTAFSGPELGGEMAAALAAASVVFRDNKNYSTKLVKGAQKVFAFARDFSRRTRYSHGNPYIEPYYNSTAYWDEYIWGAAWMFYATGNSSYLTLALAPGLSRNAKAEQMIPDLSVLSWDNKLPAAMLLLARIRLFISPGYPYEEMLLKYHNKTTINMCSYLSEFNIFKRTQGGMIQLNHGRGRPLQYVANAAFLASLYVDYLKAAEVPGLFCGPNFFPTDKLLKFSTSQIDYILGANPLNMSYVVGYGSKFPRHVHHRGASIPNNNVKYGCIGGKKWFYSRKPNPNTITGAMVAGPDKFEKFEDLRTNFTYTEATLAGNAGLTAALVSLTSSCGAGIDKNTIFLKVPPFYPVNPPNHRHWKP